MKRLQKIDLRSQSTQIQLAWLLLALLMLGYALWMGQQAVWRYDTFRSTAFDLGNMDQVIWNTAHGHWFQWTNQGADWYGPPLRLAQHFEPIIIPLSLLYVLHPDPRTLLIFQTLVLTAGALPVFLLTRFHLPRLPLVASAMAAAYLFSSPLIGLNIFDFHPVSMATTFLLYAFLALAYRRYGWFLLACFLAAACKEDVPFTVAMVGVLVIWKYKLPRLGSILLVGGMIWGLFAFLVVIPHFFPGQHNNFWYRYQSFGVSPGVAIVNILLHPWILIGAFFTIDRFNYLASLFRNAGFLALLAPEWLLPAIPSLAINLLSIDDTLLYSGVYHYNATTIPFLALAAIHGLMRIVALWQQWRGDTEAFPSLANTALMIPITTNGSSVRFFEHPFSGQLATLNTSVAHFVSQRLNAVSIPPIPRPAFARSSSTQSIAMQPTSGLATLINYQAKQWHSLGERMAPIARSLSHPRFQWLICGWIVAMLALNYFIMIPWFNIFWPISTPGPREQHIQQLLDMIPADASVSAGTDMNPHLTERRYITVFPALTFSTHDQNANNTVQYVVVDLDSIFPEDKVSATRMLNQLCQSGQFRIIQRAEGVVLLVRNST
jgi:uncharacterized membrane protein